jgi:hypothetical protein
MEGLSGDFYEQNKDQDKEEDYAVRVKTKNYAGDSEDADRPGTRYVSNDPLYYPPQLQTASHPLKTAPRTHCLSPRSTSYMMSFLGGWVGQ